MRGGRDSLTGNAYILYDEIPSISGEILVPICIILIVDNLTGVNDIYLFFNNKITGADITIFVKLLLGISETEQFTLQPDIDSVLTSKSAVVSESTKTKVDNELWSVLGNTLVKLTKCSLIKNSYCIETCSFSDKTEINKATKLARHEITTNNKSYTSRNGTTIKTDLENLGPDGFTAKVVTSKAVLPDLHKKYFVEAIDQVAEPNTVTDDMFKEYFGEDIETIDPYFKIEAMLKKLCEKDTSLNFKTLLANFKKNGMNDIKLSFDTYFRNIIANIKIGSKDDDGHALLTEDQATVALDLWESVKDEFPKIPRPICSDELKKKYPHTHHCHEETYDDFKIRMRQEIAQYILNIKNNKYYGLPRTRCKCEKSYCESRHDGCLSEIPKNVDILDGKRPLKITKAISFKNITPEVTTVISYINNLCVSKMTYDVGSKIDYKHPFTRLHEEWWIEKKEDLIKSAKNNIRKQKDERLYIERTFQ
jgi:hypothetical protein